MKKMTELERVRVDDGAEIAVRVFGTGPACALLVHGWMGDGSVWNALLARLDLAGLTVLVPDLRGAGASSRPSTGYTTARYGADLVALLDHFAARFQAARAIVVGHSMGGQLTQWLCVHQAARVRAALALCPVPATGLTLPAPAVPLFASAAGDRDKLAMILQLAMVNHAPDVHAALLRAALELSKSCIDESLASFTAGFAANSEVLRTIRATFWLVGADDPFLPMAMLQERVADFIPGARSEMIAGAGHYPQVEKPDETAAIVTAFLRAVAAEPA
jgi:non-heme chloroperoxidase